jgi:hypothetical protein
VEADDVRLEVPGAVSNRDFDPTMVHGDVHDLVLVTTENVNTWVTEIVEVSARVVEYLDGVPESSRDGDLRVYGPYADRDGRDLAWLVKIGEDGDTTSYETFIGSRDAKSEADMDRLMSGTLVVGEKTRSGGFDMDFDVVEKYSEIKGERGALNTYSGDIAVTFERDLETQKKHIDIDYIDFTSCTTGSSTATRSTATTRTRTTAPRTVRELPPVALRRVGRLQLERAGAGEDGPAGGVDARGRGSHARNHRRGRRRGRHEARRSAGRRVLRRRRAPDLAPDQRGVRGRGPGLQLRRGQELRRWPRIP